jgi:hypothetical protein
VAFEIIGNDLVNAAITFSFTKGELAFEIIQINKNEATKRIFFMTMVLMVF